MHQTRPTPTTEDLPLPRRHRALFLSDLHLGALGCRADLILDFLRRNTAPVIYLVGDFLDIWHTPFVHWTATHDAILDLLFSRQQNGTRLVYLLGNHDAAMCDPERAAILPVELVERVTHETATGQRFLVLHGDQCDSRALRWHICTRIGSRVDAILRGLDRGLRRFGRRLAPQERSLVETVLSWINDAVAMGHGHEKRLVALARTSGHDGVICGHFHLAALHADQGLTYANCGDWVDSFTAIAEDMGGKLTLLGGRQTLALPARPAPLPEPRGI